MDSSTYISELATPMLQNASTAANADNQPVNYGPMLWKVMKKVVDDIGGGEYLIGMLLNLAIRRWKYLKIFLFIYKAFRYLILTI